MLHSTFASSILVLNDWPSSKFDSLAENTLCLFYDFKYTPRMWAGVRRALRVSENLDGGSNVELEVEKIKIDGFPSAPNQDPLHLYIIWIWEKKKKRGRKSVGKRGKTINERPEHFELERGNEIKCIQWKNNCALFPEPRSVQIKHCFDGSELRKDTLYVDKTQSRTLRDLWASSHTTLLSAEGPQVWACDRKCRTKRPGNGLLVFLRYLLD